MVEFYTYETQEQEQVELSDITHAVNATYYQDSNGRFIIRQTEHDLSFVLDQEKIAEVAGHIGSSSFVKNPTMLLMPEQHYVELSEKHQALTDAVKEAEKTGKEYEQAKKKLGFDIDVLSSTKYLQLNRRDYLRWMEGIRAGYPDFAEKEKIHEEAKANLERAEGDAFLYLCEVFNIPLPTEEEIRAR